jgi:hypothetical protein
MNSLSPTESMTPSHLPRETIVRATQRATAYSYPSSRPASKPKRASMSSATDLVFDDSLEDPSRVVFRLVGLGVQPVWRGL